MLLPNEEEDLLLTWFEPGLDSGLVLSTAVPPPALTTVKSQNYIGSNEMDRVLEERRRRRKISNRESARRSRMRKQQRYADLVDQSNRLRLENQLLSNRLREMEHRSRLFLLDNGRLRFESDLLRRRFNDLTAALARQRLSEFELAAVTSANELRKMITIINHVKFGDAI